MTRTNAHGQPIGPEVPEWEPRQPPRPVTVAGRHVRLEPVAAGHAEPLFDALGGDTDDALWTYQRDDRPTDVAEMARRIAAQAADPATVTFVAIPNEGTPQGIATLFRVDVDHGSVEVGAIVWSRALRRTPASTEAISLLARYVFEELGFRRFEWKCDSLNEPSRVAAVRLGFGYEGRFRQAVVYKGRSRDTDWFAMTDSDWPAIRAAHDQWLDPANFDEDGQQRSPLSRVTSAHSVGG